ncbi:MAG: FAD-dependent thymidylate synthase, partial [Clostridia bacterium]|nr:FAD-dependent thymidylate synthase [Clostridia bacterium]
MQQHGAFIIGVSSCNEEVCAAGGRISTQQGTALEIFDRSHDKEKNARLISKVTASGHTSTVEHVFFNLAFNNVSVVVEQFMIEFRLASFTVKSRRYVDFADCGYHVPSFASAALRDRYTAHMDRLFALYARVREAQVPMEDARFVLPYCFYSNFFCSLGGREMINVLRAMLFGRGSAYPEIRAVGESLLRQAQEAAPGVFADFEEKNKDYRDLPDLPAFAREETDGPGRAVELLSFDKNAELNVARTALIERYGLPTAQADAVLRDKDTLKTVLDAVARSDRPRALEAAAFTVRFNNVSLSTVTHFVRHRIQSICIPQLKDCVRENYIIPASVRENEALLIDYVAAFEQTAALYHELQKAGVPEEDLVYVLLSGNVLDLVTTLNARELRLLLKLRTCTRAQWEI